MDSAISGTSVAFRGLAIAALTVVTVSATAGCTRSVDGHPEAEMSAVGAPLAWGDCDLGVPAEDMPAGAQCAELAVPVDYAKPDGDVAALAVIRVPATGGKIGSLVMNPGGPGGSGVELALTLTGDLPGPLRERFDIVGFDPRGTGHSRPAVTCISDADYDRWRAESIVDFTPGGAPGTDYSQSGVDRYESELQRYVQTCVDRTGTEFLANVGTANVIKDLDALRGALGDDKLTYLGFSYGTQIGAEYAEAYPDRVRAMVLDGAVDPSAGPIQWILDYAAGFQTAFNDYAADCALSEDCPLGTDPAKAVDVYHSIVQPLAAKPAKTADPRGVSYFDAVTATVSAMFSPQDWTALTNGLRAVNEGRDADDLLELADLYVDRYEDGTYTNFMHAYTAITCVDYPYPKDEAAWVEFDKRLREVSPFQTYGDFTGDAPRGVCAFWPVPATSEPHPVSAEGLPPILVISTTHDPATPYQDGVDLANQLGGTLLTFEGTQHTAAFYGVACIDDAITRYLVELTVPPANTRC